MLENVKLEEAQELIYSRITPLPAESVPLLSVAGRYIYRDVYAAHDLPPCDKSAVDGFAVSVDSGEKNHNYKIKEILRPGEMPGSVLNHGEAAGVVTGGPVPVGTVSVIPFETTRLEGDRLIFAGDLVPGENIRPRGEDFKAGELLARRGSSISPGTLGVMAAFGVSEVKVFRHPRVAVLGLGQGIVPCQAKPLPGQVRDSNGPLLAALAMRDGAQVTGVDLVGDGDLAKIKNVMEKLLRQADIVLTTGGTAAGECDQALGAVRQTGAKVLFWGVRIKPGSHSGAAVTDDKLIISLSGNPAACAAGYHLLAAPVLRFLQGHSFDPERVTAVCAGAFPKRGGPRRFIQADLEINHKGLRVSILPGQKSSMLRGLLNNGNALIDLPAGHPPLEEGAEVSVIVLDSYRNRIK
ncbi:molybdopterin molybdotransferase MoeA [Pelotomaculum propionicicum]|uniref:molybdopterin molybdotransferase MoeA n=1 Tax=Pelotomaculum propionicicum TaxID=258475 RepID=UPI003B7AB589